MATDKPSSHSHHDQEHSPGSDHDHHHDDEKAADARRVYEAEKRQHSKPHNTFKKGNPDSRAKSDKG